MKLAQRVSEAAYRGALDELERRLPNDPAMASISIDGHIFRGDLAAALHDLDVVDASVGPDPFLDGMGAMLLAKRNAPGDLERADANAATVTNRRQSCISRRLSKTSASQYRPPAWRSIRSTRRFCARPRSPPGAPRIHDGTRRTLAAVAHPEVKNSIVIGDLRVLLHQVWCDGRSQLGKIATHEVEPMLDLRTAPHLKRSQLDWMAMNSHALGV